MTAAAIIAVLGAIATGLSQYLNLDSAEKSANNVDKISALYDEVIAYYNKVSNGYQMRTTQIQNLINDLQSARYSMSGLPRSILTRALNKANKQMQDAIGKQNEASRKVMKMQDEKASKIQNEMGHAQTATFRKDRTEQNIKTDLMSEDARKALDANRKIAGGNVQSTMSTVQQHTQTQPQNQNIGGIVNNVETRL